ncbi:hypothetical protein PV10_02193 [Exophiala mesophila]|uniref:YTH domain-containing protein n=1 Tax=Exophiala mesophila TaxID=212818 RepID=A0A0D1Y1K6_EXOME|nr:uncharacterized protein PV10_02193 [Exophiala mesophila]KIV94426.1 hypothetical protein PV10_02193 [Exophiala mesophila]
MADEPPPGRVRTSGEIGQASQDRNIAVNQDDNAPQTQHSTSADFDPYTRHQQTIAAYQSPGSFNMSNVGAALPDYHRRSYEPQQSFPHQFPAQASQNQPIIYHYQQNPQFSHPQATSYNQSFVPHYPPQFAHPHQSRQQQMTFPQFMTGQMAPPASQNMMNQPMMLQQSMPQQHHIPGQFSQPHANPMFAGAYSGRMGGAYPGLPSLHIDGSLSQSQGQSHLTSQNTRAVKRTSSSSSLKTSVLRGPPRKPKQSGHALWVGNLPPSTHIIDLKDHFSNEATDEIESVFLISKSNCAFVNYKTEASCTAAMARFHDSRFHGVRLVCRLRRGSVSATATASTNPTVEPKADTVDAVPDNDESTPLVDDTLEATPEPKVAEKVKEKFFVVKSLTAEDLERSVQSGIWATQAHNEAALNAAYQASENVYLIFSANKSGEYFGYARMESAIDDESAADIGYQPRPEAPSPSLSDLPVTIFTPPTSTAPRGRIIDDSARGTIFWEALDSVSPEKELAAEDDRENLSGENEDSSTPSPGVPQTFGKPFRIRWMSTERLPFYRTRGLRNPWNANREVKIARDGTEIEPSVGRRLASMFHRPPGPNTTQHTSRQPPQPSAGPSGYLPSAPAGGYGRNY